MRKIKIIIKNTIAYGLYYSGLLSLIKKRKLRNKACVLMYHRVMPSEMLDKTHSTSGIITDRDLFRKHLTWLKQEFNVIGTNELKKIFSNDKELLSNSCLVTFDDGWLDNYLYAKILLEQEDIPATIFLPYNYIDNNLVFWQEELLARLSVLNSSGDASDQEMAQKVMGSGKLTDTHAIRSYITRLKEREYTDINAILDMLRDYQKDMSVDFKYDSYLSWEQVLEMMESRISFGSHSLTHRILTRIDDGEARQEISESKALIEKKLGKMVDTIAYPNGNSNHAIERMAADSEYRLGFTTVRGYVSKDSNPMALPRINIHTNNSLNKPLLLCNILNIF